MPPRARPHYINHVQNINPMMIALYEDLHLNALDRNLHKQKVGGRDALPPEKTLNLLADAVKARIGDDNAPHLKDVSTLILLGIVKQNTLMFEYFNEIRANLANFEEKVAAIQLSSPTTTRNNLQHHRCYVGLGVTWQRAGSSLGFGNYGVDNLAYEVVDSEIPVKHSFCSHRL